MMISPSENGEMKAGGSGAAHGKWVRSFDEGRRGVSRIEFLPLEGLEARPDSEQDTEAALRLSEEVVALSGKLKSQAEQMSADLEAIRKRARVEARSEWESELEEKIAKERSSILKACEEFRQERAKYFAGVEAEVVKLALAIAARVMHREAKLDPLLLTGVVRVALEKVAEDSSTVLRVPVGEVEMWRRVFNESQDSSLQVEGDELLDAGDCVLDTNIGKVELGVSAQLEEIERGFFDLMQQRPV
jgi:flagellar assembly protein FliH